MKCDSWNCPICRWGECVGNRDAARQFGWCEKTEEEIEEMMETENKEETMTKAEERANQYVYESGTPYPNTTMVAYLNGYNQAQKDLGWISVKERLPENADYVLTCVDVDGVPQCIGLGYYSNDAGMWIDPFDEEGGADNVDSTGLVPIVRMAEFGATWMKKKMEKERKPILEVFGFKVGDAVRLKDGDGRKHIIKSFEEVEGLHGPNFYHVEFEDGSAKDGIYPGEEYPNGYYTQMEKFEEEQKPAEWSEDYREEDIQTRFAFYTYKDEDGVLYLSNVFVEEASRNHGFGTKILIAAEKVAETIGATTISLRVKQDSPANAWYRKRGYGYVAFEDGYDWLEKNLEYMKPTKSAGWSEEDEKMRDLLIESLDDRSHYFPFKETKEKMISWLKSLRPSWKPSGEQMEALRNCTIPGTTFNIESLKSLYEQLKKLI